MKLFLLLAAAAFSAEGPRTVSVTGAGSVEAAPDMAQVSYVIADKAETMAGAASVQALAAQNRRRVEPALKYLKEVVGSDGTAEALPRISRLMEYDRKSGRQREIGYEVVTTLTAKLKGKDALDAKLGKLYDSARLKADEAHQAVLGLQEQTMEKAALEAYRKAVKAAVAAAEAQLEPGEELGPALERGEEPRHPGPRPMMMRAALSAAASDESAQAVVETGKITVARTIHFVFQVLGSPRRQR